MKKSKYSEEQRGKILREADRLPVGEVAKRDLEIDVIRDVAAKQW